MRTLFCCVIVLAISGCAKKTPEGLPPLRPCAIRIVDGDTSLKGIGVSLLRLDGQGGWSVGGTTDSAGRVTTTTILGTFEKRGAPEGEYRVVLRERIELPPELILPPDEEMSLSPAEFKNLEKRRSDHLERNRTLPSIVSSPPETPLRVSVAESGTETTIDVAGYR